MNSKKTKSAVHNIGKEFAAGVVDEITTLLVVIVGFSFLIYLIAGFFNLALDDSDKSGFERSNLKVHTDYKTGIQYLSDGKGGLIKRE